MDDQHGDPVIALLGAVIRLALHDWLREETAYMATSAGDSAPVKSFAPGPFLAELGALDASGRLTGRFARGLDTRRDGSRMPMSVAERRHYKRLRAD